MLVSLNKTSTARLKGRPTAGEIADQNRQVRDINITTAVEIPYKGWGYDWRAGGHIRDQHTKIAQVGLVRMIDIPQPPGPEGRDDRVRGQVPQISRDDPPIVTGAVRQRVGKLVIGRKQVTGDKR